MKTWNDFLNSQFVQWLFSQPVWSRVILVIVTALVAVVFLFSSCGVSSVAVNNYDGDNTNEIHVNSNPNTSVSTDLDSLTFKPAL